jgi:hypothetical protein
LIPDGTPHDTGDDGKARYIETKLGTTLKLDADDIEVQYNRERSGSNIEAGARSKLDTTKDIKVRSKQPPVFRNGKTKRQIWTGTMCLQSQGDVSNEMINKSTAPESSQRPHDVTKEQLQHNVTKERLQHNVSKEQ